MNIFLSIYGDEKKELNFIFNFIFLFVSKEMMFEPLRDFENDYEIEVEELVLIDL